MIKPITHHCGAIIGAFDSHHGRMVNDGKTGKLGEPASLGNYRFITEVVIVCHRCQKTYRFNARVAADKHNKKI